MTTEYEGRRLVACALASSARTLDPGWSQTVPWMCIARGPRKRRPAWALLLSPAEVGEILDVHQRTVIDYIHS